MTISSTAPSMRALPNIFLVDAIGSTLTGLVLIAFAPALVSLFNSAVPPVVFIILGVALLPWAIFNYWCSRRATLGRFAFGVQMAGDWSWIAASVIMLAAEFNYLSLEAFVMIGVVTIAVFGLVSLKLATTVHA